MLVRVEDGEVTYEFSGKRIAGPVSTRLDDKGRQRARWMEAELYRKPDDTYVLVQASLSTVWHELAGAGHVRKPVPATREEIAAMDRPVYCGVLPPRDGREHCPLVTLAESRGMTVPGSVIAEDTQRRVWHFPDHLAVIRRVAVARRRGDGTESAAVSRPMRELLRQAAENDPAFRPADGSPLAIML